MQNTLGVCGGRSASEFVVTDGVVSLRVTVPDRERREIAVKAAKDVRGVRKVVDLIKTVD